MSAKIIYFSHGGGPLPILGDPSHAAMVQFMRELPALVERPEAILVISAHWEAREATLTGGAQPPLLYDYYGFPEEAYHLHYAAPGAPRLAAEIAMMLHSAAIDARIDPDRGFDHGMFIPLMLMYPVADVPTLQLSILHSLDPAEHLRLGAALRPLLDQNVLVIGSGFSFHNLRAFEWDGVRRPDARNDAFQNWLIATCTGEPTQKTGTFVRDDARENALINWEAAPAARYCHPREDHLLPLHICVGLAGAPARLIFDDAILGKRALAFIWE